MNPAQHGSRSVLIVGSGIAGPTLAILLQQNGWNPLVIERDPAPSSLGYMMDFFGTGWDVAERMGLTDALRAVRYPIETMEYVDAQGRSSVRIPLERIRRALDGRYVYLRRSDLARILYDRMREIRVPVRFGTTIRALTETTQGVRVTFEDGQQEEFALVVGADGVHSHTRKLVFGPEEPFARYLGYYVAAFQLPLAPEIRQSFVLHEEPDRVASFYPVSAELMASTYIFRHPDIGHIPAAERLPFLRARYAGSGWIAERVLEGLSEQSPIFLDSLTQIKMPKWSAGRVCLIGDSCGCLTLAAGQGSHMAMAGAFVLATELTRHAGDFSAAFAAYENFLRPHVERKQQQGARLAGSFVPSSRSRLWLRRLVIRAIFSSLLIRWTFRGFGARSVLRDYQ
jgi:2-polyprenyl-6-methoxyphenol hydroxylase-like FAD-dependent oxidoreductase